MNQRRCERTYLWPSLRHYFGGCPEGLETHKKETQTGHFDSGQDLKPQPSEYEATVNDNQINQYW